MGPFSTTGTDKPPTENPSPCPTLSTCGFTHPCQDIFDNLDTKGLILPSKAYEVPLSDLLNAFCFIHDLNPKDAKITGPGKEEQKKEIVNDKLKTEVPTALELEKLLRVSFSELVI